ncbi:hypothetical protein WKY82_10405 [Gordonia malaquae]|uniref:hypothetical protein n=1 Tax=Gordonia malaquae TaxID=410332 RepID=UPI0030C7A117
MTTPTSKPCRTCGAPIFFARFKQRWVALDWRPSPDGRWEVTRDDASRLRGRLLTNVQAADTRARAGTTFMSHTRTCNPTGPVAESRRKGYIK